MDSRNTQQVDYTPFNGRAAIAWNAQDAIEVIHAELSPPQADEILVRIHGVGICHSDIVAMAGFLPAPLPAVFGHEGAGIVEAVGSAVKTIVPGDRVVLTFRSCGDCQNCKRNNPAYCSMFLELNLRGRRADGSCSIRACDKDVGSNFFGQSSFADYALAYERNVVKVPDDVPIEILGPLGCGVQTGAGSVMRSFRCPPGSSILITGGGSVGLSAAMGAVVQGCATIIVSDPEPSRRAMAMALGATHVIDPVSEDLVTEVLRICGGVDYALDTSGVMAVVEASIMAVRPLGTLGLAAIPPEVEAQIPCNILTAINRGLSIRGIASGDSNPQEFIPELIALYKDGRFPFDRLIRTYRFDEINEAIADQKAGRCIKPVLLTSANASEEVRHE